MKTRSSHCCSEPSCSSTSWLFQAEIRRLPCARQEGWAAVESKGHCQCLEHPSRLVKEGMSLLQGVPHHVPVVPVFRDVLPFCLAAEGERHSRAFAAPSSCCWVGKLRLLRAGLKKEPHGLAGVIHKPWLVILFLSLVIGKLGYVGVRPGCAHYSG